MMLQNPAFFSRKNKMPQVQCHMSSCTVKIYQSECREYVAKVCRILNVDKPKSGCLSAEVKFKKEKSVYRLT